MNHEAFTYWWVDLKNNMHYVGYHKHRNQKKPFQDGYICSQPWFLEEYNKRPQDFKRTILVEGSTSYCHLFEVAILKSVDAMNSQGWYNQTNGQKNFRFKHHSEEFKRNKSAHMKEIRNTPVAKRQARLWSQKMWSNSEYRQNQSKWAHERFGTTEGREKQSRRMKEYFNANPHASEAISKRMKGTQIAKGNHYNSGKIWITNGKKNNMIYPSEPIPTGFYKGRNPVENITLERMSKSHKGRVWINCGLKSKMIQKDQDVPFGWKLGRK